MTVYRPDHQDWHDLLGLECTCEEAWSGRGMVDDRCWYHRTIDVLDDRGMGKLLDRVLYRHRNENSCLGCESDMNSCIDAFTNDLGKCCKGCDHSEFVQVWPSTDPTSQIGDET